jgi:hypothetical protein
MASKWKVAVRFIPGLMALVTAGTPRTVGAF